MYYNKLLGIRISVYSFSWSQHSFGLFFNERVHYEVDFQTGVAELERYAKRVSNGRVRCEIRQNDTITTLFLRGSQKRGGRKREAKVTTSKGYLFMSNYLLVVKLQKTKSVGYITLIVKGF